MFIYAFLILVLWGGAIATDDICKDGGGGEMCRNLSEVGYFQFPQSVADIDRMCPLVLKFMDCLKDYEDECGAEKIYLINYSRRKVEALINLTNDICREDSQLRINLVANLNCMKNQIANHHSNCFDKIQDELKKLEFYIQEFEQEQDRPSDMWLDYECFADSVPPVPMKTPQVTVDSVPPVPFKIPQVTANSVPPVPIKTLQVTADSVPPVPIKTPLVIADSVPPVPIKTPQVTADSVLPVPFKIPQVRANSVPPVPIKTLQVTADSVPPVPIKTSVTANSVPSKLLRYHAMEIACYASDVSKNCGKDAEDVSMEILVRAEYLDDFCPQTSRERIIDVMKMLELELEDEIDLKNILLMH
ncbi:hypothetical protein CEXT_524151 [Caerostris extrusa]|uniref:Uncharacterized protein n=1 Tax=Caerostris extrusa TaxID=172846 RepID=A0AAV4SJM2_CAEEX|nr:hypothetical protein CEXT_524151 [Caerostris extrusa]